MSNVIDNLHPGACYLSDDVQEICDDPLGVLNLLPSVEMPVCPVGGGPVDANCLQAMLPTLDDAAPGCPVYSPASLTACLIAITAGLVPEAPTCPIGGGAVDANCLQALLPDLDGVYPECPIYSAASLTACLTGILSGVVPKGPTCPVGTGGAADTACLQQIVDEFGPPSPSCPIGGGALDASCIEAVVAAVRPEISPLPQHCQPTSPVSPIETPKSFVDPLLVVGACVSALMNPLLEPYCDLAAQTDPVTPDVCYSPPDADGDGVPDQRDRSRRP